MPTTGGLSQQNQIYIGRELLWFVGSLPKNLNLRDNPPVFVQYRSEMHDFIVD